MCLIGYIVLRSCILSITDSYQCSIILKYSGTIWSYHGFNGYNGFKFNTGKGEVIL